ncbi:hypothetical protein [Trichocoleus sp. FACHB-46]|uniref:Uncharacterized protein n=1 Tax=Trichocoleus desertorum GB2-A4 TaxID=2933944 RepID=A0ABV0J6K2_9CYAN|nr:hypothetical protein [Trichocoleus sp. FACHB-46]MBD1863528.1 hypothetical protein [Trichocoleus sp. FACHB-46]
MMGLSSVSTLDSSPLNSSRNVASWVQELQKADQTFYNMMTLEIWSLAQTMDEIQPGFWADYMRNRQTIVQQYIKERRRQDPKLNHPSLHKSASTRKRSPFGWATEKPVPEIAGQRVTAFSETLERDLPKVTPRSVRPLRAEPPVDESATLSDLVLIDVFEEAESGTSPLANQPSVIEAEASISPLPGPLPGLAQAPASALTKASRETTMQSRAVWSASPTPTRRTPAVDLVKLPHLMRFPVVKVAPTLVPPQAAGNLATTVVACWLTRNFLVQAPYQEGPLGVSKRCDRITLEPGQTIVCQLGFQLKGLTSAVQVQLVKALRSQHQLTVAWFEPTAQTNEAGAVETPEVMVQLTNRGTQPCSLQAGQAFCRLEFLCSTS